MSPIANTDSLRVVVDGLSDLGRTTPLEWILNIATLFIAIAGLVTSIIVAIKSRSDNKELNNSARKVELMKTLILDHQMSFFFSIFNKLSEVLEKLKERECNKKEVEKEIQSNLRILNEEFLLLFQAIDEALYERLLKHSDAFRDKLVESIGNDGINLFVDNMFSEYIQIPLRSAKRGLISTIYNYAPEA